jgi:hypothetical protein
MLQHSEGFSLKFFNFCQGQNTRNFQNQPTFRTVRIIKLSKDDPAGEIAARNRVQRNP